MYTAEVNVKGTLLSERNQKGCTLRDRGPSEPDKVTVTETRSVVTRDEGGEGVPRTGEHRGLFWSDRTIVCPGDSVGYKNLYLC